jgi:hypothetical protein
MPGKSATRENTNSERNQNAKTWTQECTCCISLILRKQVKHSINQRKIHNAYSTVETKKHPEKILDHNITAKIKPKAPSKKHAPVANIGEWLFVGNVVHKKKPNCTAIVSGGDREAGTSRVPNLALAKLLVDFDGANLEINADCGGDGRVENVVGKTEQQAALARARVSYNHHFQEVVMRGWTPSSCPQACGGHNPCSSHLQAEPEVLHWQEAEETVSEDIFTHRFVCALICYPRYASQNFNPFVAFDDLSLESSALHKVMQELKRSISQTEQRSDSGRQGGHGGGAPVALLRATGDFLRWLHGKGWRRWVMFRASRW